MESKAVAAKSEADEVGEEQQIQQSVHYLREIPHKEERSEDNEERAEELIPRTTQEGWKVG